MSNPSNDRPRVIVFPPVILIATIALSFLLQWLVPLGLLTGIDPRWRIGVGLAIFAAGVLLCVIARTSLVRRGTNVNPLQPTTALATDGIYGWTRNPIYVGRRSG
jgi:protein-S-isoprenylcysteine O-methyltransferase Ste14